MPSKEPAKQKASWPLLVVAACSFIPGLGFLFAAVSVTWGLLSERRRAKLAVLIGAIGALLNLAGAGLLMWQVDQSGGYRQARIEITRQDLTRLVSAIQEYRDRTGAYPQNLRALTRGRIQFPPVNIYDQSGGIFARPRLYRYHVALEEGSYDLFSVGPDGEPGTEDDIRPVLSDSARVHSGYRPGTMGRSN